MTNFSFLCLILFLIHNRIFTPLFNCLRLTPLYMMVIAFYTTLFKYFGSGPYWPRTSDANCKANWWTNLLYINNIVRNSKPVRDSECYTVQYKPLCFHRIIVSFDIVCIVFGIGCTF